MSVTTSANEISMVRMSKQINKPTETISCDLKKCTGDENCLLNLSNSVLLVQSLDKE